MFSLITEVAPKRLTSLVKSTFIKKKLQMAALLTVQLGTE